jgi:hypothetical protein
MEWTDHHQTTCPGKNWATGNFFVFKEAKKEGRCLSCLGCLFIRFMLIMLVRSVRRPARPTSVCRKANNNSKIIKENKTKLFLSFFFERMSDIAYHPNR